MTYEQAKRALPAALRASERCLAAMQQARSTAGKGSAAYVAARQAWIDASDKVAAIYATLY